MSKVSTAKPLQKKSNDFSFFGVNVNSKFPCLSVNVFAKTLLFPFTKTPIPEIYAEVSLGFLLKCPVI